MSNNGKEIENLNLDNVVGFAGCTQASTPPESVPTHVIATGFKERKMRVSSKMSVLSMFRQVLVVAFTTLCISACEGTDLQEDEVTDSVSQAICSASQTCANGTNISCNGAGSICIANQDTTGLYVQCDSGTRIYCPAQSSKCPTPADITYWVDPIDGGNGAWIRFALTACKPSGFTTCDLTVTLTTNQINSSGSPVTQKHSIFIPKSQSCTQKHFAHACQEVLSVSVDSVSSSNCSVPCSG